jgi:small GTP-binding protein
MVVVKLIMVGSAMVGKTSYIRRISGKGFSPSYLCTIGIDFYKDRRTFGKWSGAMGTPFHEAFNVTKKTPLDVFTWDTAGQERFHSLSKSYFKGIDGAFVCFALNDRLSFDKVTDWIRSVHEANRLFNHRDALPMVLLGMKRDLKSQRQVSSEEAMDLASKHSMPYFETSSETGCSVVSSYEALVQLILHSPTFVRSFRVQSTQAQPGRTCVKPGCSSTSSFSGCPCG